MKYNRLIVLFFCIGLLATLSLSCAKKSEDVPKQENEIKGNYTGTATNKVNSNDKKALSINITSTSPTIAGTYTFNNVSGKVTGSVLGLILNITLKPDATGSTYAVSAAADDDDNTLAGTMTGVEGTTSITYSFTLKR